MQKIPMDSDFYKDAGFVEFEQKSNEPVPSSGGSWPSLEDEREQVANKEGWFDPRLSRRWMPTKEKKAEEPQSAPVTAPAVPEPQSDKKTETPAPAVDKKVEAPAAESDKKAKVPSAANDKKADVPTATDSKPVEAPKAVESKPVEAPKPAADSKPVEAPKPPTILAKDVPMDKEFYESSGFVEFKQRSGEPAPDTRAKWPSLEEEREGDANKRGWFDPRMSRRWDQLKDLAKEPVKSAPKFSEPTPIDKDYYESGGWIAFKAKSGEPAPNTRADWPSLEEEREGAYNKLGMYDPRYSRRWDQLKDLARDGSKAPTKFADPKPMDKDYYESGGWIEYNRKSGEPAPNTRGDWPSLEEEREGAYNKLGMYDPRFSRRWDQRKELARNAFAKVARVLPKPL